jgi:hypothetical protein
VIRVDRLSGVTDFGRGAENQQVGGLKRQAGHVALAVSRALDFALAVETRYA